MSKGDLKGWLDARQKLYGAKGQQFQELGSPKYAITKAAYALQKTLINNSPKNLRTFFGNPNKVKFNNGGKLQPYGQKTGQFKKYSSNPGFKQSAPGLFSAGFGQGRAAAKGASGD